MHVHSTFFLLSLRLSAACINYAGPSSTLEPCQCFRNLGTQHGPSASLCCWMFKPIMVELAFRRMNVGCSSS